MYNIFKVAVAAVISKKKKKSSMRSLRQIKQSLLLCARLYSQRFIVQRKLFANAYLKLRFIFFRGRLERTNRGRLMNSVKHSQPVIHITLQHGSANETSLFRAVMTKFYVCLTCAEVSPV